MSVPFGIALPNYGPLATPATLVRLARLAEDLGVDSVWVSDHLVAPVGVRSVYPYDRRANRTPKPIKALGRYAHEAVVIDPKRGHAFLTEDASGPNGLLSRWTPPQGFEHFAEPDGQTVQLVAGKGGRILQHAKVWLAVDQ